MKKIIFMLITLIVALSVFGTVVITYATSPHRTYMLLTPTPTATVSMTIPESSMRDTTPQPQVSEAIFSQGDGSQPEIALTFDDGPDLTYTPQVLSILQQYNVHATFFTVGDHVQAYPGLTQQEYANGNIVGNHSWDHPDLTTLSADDIHAQLSNTSDVIQSATGVRPVFFRPPYGAYNYQTLNQASSLGLTTVTWSVDTEDWQRPGSSAIIDTVLTDAQNGSVILMHDGGGDRSETVEALPTIITKLQEKGFRLVTLQQLVTDSQNDK